MDTLVLLWIYGSLGCLIALGMGLYEHLVGERIP